MNNNGFFAMMDFILMIKADIRNYTGKIIIIIQNSGHETLSTFTVGAN